MNIEVKHISYHPNGAGRSILQDVCANFAPGHLTALLGPNGSGKTTLLRHFLSQLQPTEGRIEVGGKSPQDYSAKELAKILSWVPQQGNESSAFTVEDMVSMARYPYKKAFDAENEEDRQIVAQAMDELEVAELRTRMFSSLSGGERQRVLIARALAQSTPWVLMDEPTSNLDVRHQIEMLELLRQKVDAGRISAVVVMHDFNLVERYCDRAVLLQAGEVVSKGATSEVLVPEVLEHVYGVHVEVLEKSGQRFFFPTSKGNTTS